MATQHSNPNDVTKLHDLLKKANGRQDISGKCSCGITSGAPQFTLFNDLPHELRFKIWHLTFQPQVITVRVESHGRISPSKKSKFPIALRVCRESRREALTWYELCFRHGPSFPTYVNPHIDIPHIRHGSRGCRTVMPVLPYPGFDFSLAFLQNLRVFMGDEIISTIRHLAIDRDLWVLRMGSAPRLMRLFERLEKLTIVIDPNFLYDDEEWVDDSDDEEMADVDTQYDMYEDEDEIKIEVLEVWDNSDSETASGKYHRRAEKQEYAIDRLKLAGSEWDYPHSFTPPLCSSRYAAFVKQDVIEQLNGGSQRGVLLKRPEVNVMFEIYD